MDFVSVGHLATGGRCKKELSKKGTYAIISEKGSGAFNTLPDGTLQNHYLGYLFDGN